MSSPMYVVAQSGQKIELVHGSFAELPIGFNFPRDQRIYGKSPWTIIKKPDPETQKLLTHLSGIMSYEQFQKLTELVKVEVR